MCQNQVIFEMAQNSMISRFFLPESFLMDKSTRELKNSTKKIPAKVLLKLAIIFCFRSTLYGESHELSWWNGEMVKCWIVEQGNSNARGKFEFQKTVTLNKILWRKWKTGKLSDIKLVSWLEWLDMMQKGTEQEQVRKLNELKRIKRFLVFQAVNHQFLWC